MSTRQNQLMLLLETDLLDEQEKLSPKRLNMKIALIMDNLTKRGISLVRADDGGFERIVQLFAKKNPQALLILGNRSVIDRKYYICVSTDDAVRRLLVDDSACAILINDKSFDDIASDRQAADLIYNGRMAVVGNKYYGASDLVATGSNRTVFISGSNTLTRLPAYVAESLDKIVKEKLNVVVGDSPAGADVMVAKYLQNKTKEEKLIICGVEREPRNRLSGCLYRRIECNTSLKGRSRQVVKDRWMVVNSEMGLAIFEPMSINRYGNIQVSSGTLRNVVQMVILGKPVKLFYAYEGKWLSRTIERIGDLQSIVSSYSNENLSDEKMNKIYSALGKDRKASVDLRAGVYDFGRSVAIEKASIIGAKLSSLIKLETNLDKNNDSQSSLL